MVHYGLTGPADQQPLNYMIGSLDPVSRDLQQHLHQQQELLQQQSASKAPPPSQRSQFYCDQCNMVFGSKSAHTSHMKSHAKEAAAAAAVAAEGPGMVGLGQGGPVAVGNGAAGAAAGGDPYQCDKCNKTFAVPARLVSLIRTNGRGGGGGEVE